MQIDLDNLYTRLKGCVFGQKIVYKPVLDSTNDFAKHVAQDGAIEGTVVIADEQTRGRGRLGRVWHSPRGTGLWFSTILRPNLNPQMVSALSLLPAVAIAQTIEKLFSIRPELKWPNDVMLSHKKVAGILAEAKSSREILDFLVLGVGINLWQNRHDFPPILCDKATSLFIETGIQISRLDVLAEILDRMDTIYATIQRQGMYLLIEEWRQYAAGFGEKVVIKEGEERFSGVLQDIALDGSAILHLDDGQVKRLSSGECTVLREEYYAADR